MKTQMAASQPPVFLVPVVLVAVMMVVMAMGASAPAGKAVGIVIAII
jgi:hypothetical protein